MDFASSRSRGDRARARQGKGFATANADAVDTAETLVAGSIRVTDKRSRLGGELLLGRYRLVAQLGAGGFGVVWHAHDEQLDRPVALKRIPLPGEEDRERATREALATARLSHPAIVALYEARADEDAFYLISELVQGDTLALLIAEDELGDEEVLEIGVALCDALAHAHARGVIHRDVKPHNVLVPREESPLAPRPLRPPSWPTSAARRSRGRGRSHAAETCSARSPTWRPSRATARRPGRRAISTRSPSSCTRL